MYKDVHYGIICSSKTSYHLEQGPESAKKKNIFHLKCLATWKLLNKLWDIHTMEC